MAGKDIIMARQRELKRLHVVQKVLEGSLKRTEAAEILSKKDRHGVDRRIWHTDGDGGS